MNEMAQVSFALNIPTTELSTATQAPAALPGTGIRSLMMAVLENATHGLRSADRLVRAEAEHWIASRERRYVFSFAVICETLDLEPSVVRRSVMRLLDKKQGRGRLLKRSRPNVRHTGALRLAGCAQRLLKFRSKSPPVSQRGAVPAVSGRQVSTAKNLH